MYQTNPRLDAFISATQETHMPSLLRDTNATLEPLRHNREGVEVLEHPPEPVEVQVVHPQWMAGADSDCFQSKAGSECKYLRGTEAWTFNVQPSQACKAARYQSRGASADISHFEVFQVFKRVRQKALEEPLVWEVQGPE